MTKETKGKWKNISHLTDQSETGVIPSGVRLRDESRMFVILPNPLSIKLKRQSRKFQKRVGTSEDIKSSCLLFQLFRINMTWITEAPDQHEHSESVLSCCWMKPYKDEGI